MSSRCDPIPGHLESITKPFVIVEFSEIEAILRFRCRQAPQGAGHGALMEQKSCLDLGRQAKQRPGYAGGTRNVCRMPSGGGVLRKGTFEAGYSALDSSPFMDDPSAADGRGTSTISITGFVSREISQAAHE